MRTNMGRCHMATIAMPKNKHRHKAATTREMLFSTTSCIVSLAIQTNETKTEDTSNNNVSLALIPGLLSAWSASHLAYRLTTANCPLHALRLQTSSCWQHKLTLKWQFPYPTWFPFTL